MKQSDNPYTPNAGAEPQAVVGRDVQLENFEILLGRMAKGRTEQSMIITGLRGVGKTVLLGQFREKALSKNWVVIEFEGTKHSEDTFRRQIAGMLRQCLFELSPRKLWKERARRAAAVLTSFTLSLGADGALTFGADIEAAEGWADHGDLATDLTDALIAVGEAAQESGRGVVFLFDEIQFLNASQFESLIQALHKTVQRKLPLTLVGAGLPQIAELAGDAKSYAERLFKFPRIGYLAERDAKMALVGPAAAEGVAFAEEALALAVEATGGYPYFLQELGYAVWPIAQGNTITRDDVELALPGYQAKLDESFFRVRFDRSTDLQKAYLRAMAELGEGPQKASDVAEVMGRESRNLAPVRAELINMGLLYTPEYGQAEFTVPHFGRFMLRIMPELKVPELRSPARRAR